jgi:hypothetical protein
MHAPLIGVAFSAAGVLALPLGMPMPGGSNAMLRGNAGGASSGAPPHEYPDGASRLQQLDTQLQLLLFGPSGHFSPSTKHSDLNDARGQRFYDDRVLAQGVCCRLGRRSLPRSAYRTRHGHPTRLF